MRLTFIQGHYGFFVFFILKVLCILRLTLTAGHGKSYFNSFARRWKETYR